MTAVEQHSPFHAGELEVQNLVGVDERILDIGQRVIRDHLLPQHQEFYHSQHQLLLSIVDSNGRPWVAIVAGEPGFVAALSSRRLRVNALPIGLLGSSADEAIAQLDVGAQVGVLGIDYSTRRRNRVNGRVVSVDPTGFEIQVVQSFGNCQKYIQLRDTELAQLCVWQAPPVAGVSMAALDDDWRALIRTNSKRAR